jgi:anti-sigma factor RsiW
VPKTLRRTIKGLLLRYMPAMLSCEEFEAFIDDYLDGNLSTSQTIIFEFHMKVCRECHEYLDAYNQSRHLAKAALGSKSNGYPTDVPEELIKNVIRAMRN